MGKRGSRASHGRLRIRGRAGPRGRAPPPPREAGAGPGRCPQLVKNPAVSESSSFPTSERQTRPLLLYYNAEPDGLLGVAPPRPPRPPPFIQRQTPALMPRGAGTLPRPPRSVGTAWQRGPTARRPREGRGWARASQLPAGLPGAQGKARGSGPGAGGLPEAPPGVSRHRMTRVGHVPYRCLGFLTCKTRTMPAHTCWVLEDQTILGPGKHQARHHFCAFQEGLCYIFKSLKKHPKEKNILRQVKMRWNSNFSTQK